MDIDPALDGRPWAEVRARLSLGTSEFPGWTEFVSRVVASLRDIVTSEAPGRLLVVTYAEAVTASFAMFLGLPALPAGFACAIEHASLAGADPQQHVVDVLGGAGRSELAHHAASRS